MAKKITKTKTPKPSKAPEVRASEVAQFKAKFRELGMTTEDEGIAKLVKFLDDFETHGFGASGILRFPHWSMVAQYKFSTQPNVISEINFHRTK
jgi:hypothetical protein